MPVQVASMIIIFNWRNIMKYVKGVPRCNEPLKKCYSLQELSERELKQVIECWIHKCGANAIFKVTGVDMERNSESAPLLSKACKYDRKHEMALAVNNEGLDIPERSLKEILSMQGSIILCWMTNCILLATEDGRKDIGVDDISTYDNESLKGIRVFKPSLEGRVAILEAQRNRDLKVISALIDSLDVLKSELRTVNWNLDSVSHLARSNESCMHPSSSRIDSSVDIHEGWKDVYGCEDHWS